MYLKKLEICGFKSFARKTEVIFEKGVTAVVGPNGCGKSNISDSIRWVLGERSAKMLRGSKMEDVIFQGTDSRAPINFAEVTLTIDNSDHVLPIQFDEVAITRRLHRSGESEYLLNKTTCRLKDIQDIILDTGIGSNSYSMIEQGRIDYILNAEADERRFLIEEAAGISKFKVKKDEAIRKLDQTEQNLLRLNDIVAEVERNIKYAERQAKRAEQYKVQFEKLKTLELANLSYEINQMNEKKGSLSNERTRLDVLTDEYRAKLAELSEALTKSQNEYHALEESFFKVESDRIHFEQTLASTKREFETTRERYHETKTTIEKNSQEIAKIETSLEQLTKDLAEKETEYGSIAETYAKLSAEKEEMASRLSLWHEEVNARAIQLIEYRDKSFQIATNLADFKNQNTKLVASAHNLEERGEQFSEEIEQIKSETSKMGSDLINLESELSGLRTAVSEKNSLVQKLASQKFSETEKHKSLFTSLNELKEKRFGLVNKLELIGKLDGSSFQNVKEVLEKCKQKNPAVFQSVQALLDLIEVADGYEIAAAAALSEYSKAVIADNPRAAIEILEQIQSEGQQQMSILVRGSNQVNQPDSSIQSHPLIKTRLLNVIKVRPGYESLFETLIGNAYVIDDVSINQISEYESLSNRADLVTRKGVFIGKGFRLAIRGTAISIKEHGEDKTQLTQELTVVESRIAQLEHDIVTQESELKAIESLFKSESEQLVAIQLKISVIETASRNMREQKARLIEELEILKIEQSETIEEQTSATEKLSELEVQIASLESEEREVKIKLEEETKWVEARKLEREEKLVLLTKAETRLETHEDSKKRSKNNLDLVRSSFDEATRRISELKESQIELTDKIAKLETLSESLKITEEETQTALINATSEAASRRQKRDEAAQVKVAIESERSSLQEEFNQVTNESHVFEKKELEIDYQKTSAIERIKNTYHLEIVESELTQHTEQGFDPEATSETIAELKKKVETFGTVNLLAIEEYSELKERFDFMSTQRKDLEDSKEALLEAIRKINRTTKQLFEETFTKVRENFGVYFKLLFEGGMADLVLVDETNPLESGIDIIARPPGKKPQHISLLSGGEKAMTAIALLFALFKVKPSPFCVLDEIDAPLDEANNERFIKMVREFIHNTQFIVVTHSRKTISMADSLYGVTMEEAGISKIVSVKISRDSWTIEHGDAKVQKELNAIIQ